MTARWEWRAAPRAGRPRGRLRRSPRGMRHASTAPPSSPRVRPPSSARRPTATPSASASPSPTASPSASPSPSPSASATHAPSGPITGAAAGTPVTPEIFLATVDTGSGQLRVVVDVPGIFEDGGLCTVKVTDGGAEIQKHNTGAADATSTACGLFTFALSDLAVRDREHRRRRTSPRSTPGSSEGDEGDHPMTAAVTQLRAPADRRVHRRAPRHRHQPRRGVDQGGRRALGQHVPARLHRERRELLQLQLDDGRRDPGLPRRQGPHQLQRVPQELPREHLRPRRRPVALPRAARRQVRHLRGADDLRRRAGVPHQPHDAPGDDAEGDEPRHDVRAAGLAISTRHGIRLPGLGAVQHAYYGLFIQLYSAAGQLCYYGYPGTIFTWYPVGAWTAVRYSPNSACGTSAVYIQNRATAALYYYTPYQPNTAALANLYGTGDACSAYGNRNFWRTWWDWFGDPTGAVTATTVSPSPSLSVSVSPSVSPSSVSRLPSRCPRRRRCRPRPRRARPTRPRRRRAPSDSPSPSPTTTTTAPPAPTVITYTVVPGDTLSKIAARYKTTVAAIAAANSIKNVNLIYVGQKFTITVGGSGSTPTPTPTPTPTTTTTPTPTPTTTTTPRRRRPPRRHAHGERRLQRRRPATPCTRSRRGTTRPSRRSRRRTASRTSTSSAWARS